MAEFHTLLTFDVPAPAGGDPEKETELDAAKAAVAANANLFMGMNEEEFAKYLQTFVQDVWVLLTKVTLEPRQVGSQGLKAPVRLRKPLLSSTAWLPQHACCCVQQRYLAAAMSEHGRMDSWPADCGRQK